MRKLAGATTPCQSKAAVTRLTRSPPAAKKLATTKMTTSARNAIGSRNDSRGDGHPALNLRADSSARSTCARHSACVTGSWLLAAMSVRDRRLPGDGFRRCCDRAGAGRHRCWAAATSAAGTPLRPCDDDEHEQPDGAGAAAATPATDRPRKRREKARCTVASAASAGHNRSHNKLPRARLSARASRNLVGCSRIVTAGRSASSKSRSVAVGLRRIFVITITLTRADLPSHACGYAPKANPACDRAQSIGQLQGAGAPAPIRAPLTSTSGTKARVL